MTGGLRPQLAACLSEAECFALIDALAVWLIVSERRYGVRVYDRRPPEYYQRIAAR